MTLNLKVLLLSSTCILACGIFVSYKSFEIQKNQQATATISQSQEISQWVASQLEQKLTQMEASVSYLDQSTIETLKRFGARYFAYAYKKGESWSVKWKVIGKMGKDEILAEVNQISYSELPTGTRTWIRQKENLIFVSPVELAETHQLKSGFLVFGVDDSFFGFIQAADTSIDLLSLLKEPVLGEGAPQFEADLFPSDQALASASTDDPNTYLTSYFTPMAQLWVVREASAPSMAYVGSRHFTYGILASLVMILGFVLLAIPALKQEATLKTRRLTFPKLSFQPLFDYFRKPKYIDEATPTRLNSTEVEVIEDFSELMDDILAEEMQRLDKVGVTLKTQYVEEAKVMCSPQHISDLIKRLIGNSVLTLEKEDEKEIQIQLVEQQKSYQLIYVDTRSQGFPSGEESSLFLQSEGSLEGIDGIIAYASWLFGEGLTVAKKGFCLSVDLPKAGMVEPAASASQTRDFTDTLQRIEIDENDTEIEGFSDFAPLDTVGEQSDLNSEPAEQDKVSFDDVIEQFRMKQFEFSDEASASVDDGDSSDEEIQADEKGFFEINSGDFKIKIRSPRKKDSDVNR